LGKGLAGLGGLSGEDLTLWTGGAHPPGCAFGVLHKVGKDDLDRIDAAVLGTQGAAHTEANAAPPPPFATPATPWAERNSRQRVRWKALLYDPSGIVLEVSCWAHVVAKESTTTFANASPRPGPNRAKGCVPEARLVETMVQGLVANGVDSSYVEWLRKHPSVPRTPLDLLESFPVPEDVPSWVRGVTEATKDVTYCNGKVLSLEDGDSAGTLAQLGWAGGDAEVLWCRQNYDPRYGIECKVEDMSDEHRATVEDSLFRSPMGGHLRVIALERNPEID